MNPLEISQQVKNNIELIESLKKELYHAKNEIEKSYAQKLRTPENYLDELKEKYEELACSIAEEAGKCPTSRWGQYLPPTEVEARPEGIVLTWEEEHPYHASNYHYYTVSWEKLINKNGEKNETE